MKKMKASILTIGFSQKSLFYLQEAAEIINMLEYNEKLAFEKENNRKKQSCKKQWPWRKVNHHNPWSSYQSWNESKLVRFPC